MKNRNFLATAIFATLAASPSAFAQGLNSNGGSWQSGSQPGVQVNEFWNNASYDGNACNIGYYVDGSGFGPCINQNPGAFPSPLAWVNSAYLAQAVPNTTSGSAFEFEAGTYWLSFLGQIAGASPNREMGIMTSDGSDGINGVASIQFAAAPYGFQVTAVTSFKFYLQSYAPTGTTYYTSMDNSPRQFAVFANSNGGNGDNTGEWLVGAEDNSCIAIDAQNGCPGLADFDFNDGLVVVTAVPEPSTYALLGAGLLAIAGMARSRRRAGKP